MDVFLSFLPWILYWVLIGNTSFIVASGITLVVLAGMYAAQKLHGKRPNILETGGLVFFAASFVLALFVDDAEIEHWLAPASNAAIFLIALVGLLIGRPFVRDYAVATVTPEIAETEGFRAVTTQLTWVWIAAFAAMTVSSAVPPLVDGDASLRDQGHLLSVLCYWIIPYGAMGLAGIASTAYPAYVQRKALAAA